MDLLALDDAIQSRRAAFLEAPTLDADMDVGRFDRLVGIVTSGTAWNDRSRHTRELRDLFAQRVSEGERFGLYMHWKALSVQDFPDIDRYRDQAIKYIQGHADDACMLAKMVRGGHIHFDVHDVSQLPSAFVKCVLNTIDDWVYDEDCGRCKDGSYAKASSLSPSSCSAAELFLVHCLRSSHPDKNEILSRLPRVCHPARMVLPMRYRVFQGDDLLDKISEYYDAPDRLPVAIKYRRNVHVVLGNHSSDTHLYTTIRDKVLYTFQAQGMSIELPHMCYVYPTKARLSVDGRGDAGQPMLPVRGGIDVIKSPKNHWSTVTLSPCGRQSGDNDIDIESDFDDTTTHGGVCTHITLHLVAAHERQFHHPRISGTAVVLV